MQIKKWLITLFVAFLIFASLGFVKFTQIQAAIAFGESFPEPSETVTSISLTPSTWSETYAVAGTVLAPQQVDLSVEIGGIVERVVGVSGAEVKQGDIFLRVNAAQELAELAAIDAQIELAKLDVQRAEQLVSQKATGQRELDRAKAELKVTEAQRAALQAVIDKKQIVVPFSGRLGLHNLEQGQFVEANIPLVELSNTSNGLWVDFTIPESKLSWLNNPITVRLNEYSFPAKLLTTGTSIDPSTRKLPVRVMVETSDLLIPSAVVSVGLSSSNALDVYRLPNTALRYDALGSFVYVLNQDENGQPRAQRADVDVIAKGQEYSIIANTLPSGTNIANIGSFKLRQNILVNLAE